MQAQLMSSGQSHSSEMVTWRRKVMETLPLWLFLGITGRHKNITDAQDGFGQDKGNPLTVHYIWTQAGT